MPDDTLPAKVRRAALEALSRDHEKEQDRARYAAAEKWVRAMNHHGGFGTWAFMVCKEPNRFGEMLERFKIPVAA